MVSGRIRVPTGSGSGPTRPCGRHQIGAGRGEEPLHLVAGRGERLGGPLVHDQDRTAGSHRGAGVPQRLDRPREVVHAFDEQHQVVPRRPVGRPVGQVDDLQVHPVGHAVVDRVARGRARSTPRRCPGRPRVMCGNALASSIAAQPVPQARSATRAGPSVSCSRASTSGSCGSHSATSEFTNAGRFSADWRADPVRAVGGVRHARRRSGRRRPAAAARRPTAARTSASPPR